MAQPCNARGVNRNSQGPGDDTVIDELRRPMARCPVREV
jgi:hypothetical protein